MEFNFAYLAGFFDGEGSVGVYKRNWDRTKTIQYYTATMSLAQSGTWGFNFLSELQKKYGGHIRKAPNSDKKTMYHWQLDANKMLVFLEDILPFLLYKKEQVELVIKFQKLPCKRCDSVEAQFFEHKLKELKQ